MSSTTSERAASAGGKRTGENERRETAVAQPGIPGRTGGAGRTRKTAATDRKTGGADRKTGGADRKTGGADRKTGGADRRATTRATGAAARTARGGAKASATRPARGTRPASGSWGRRLARWLLILTAAAATAVFGLVLFRLTLTPQPASSPYVTDNTEPGATLRLYLDRPSVRMAIREIGGNFILFAPLGALLPIVVRRLAGPLRIGLVAAVLSLAIETAQGTIVTGRSFDADDVILNTAGAVLAYLVIGRQLARWSARRG